MVRLVLVGRLVLWLDLSWLGDLCCGYTCLGWETCAVVRLVLVGRLVLWLDLSWLGDLCCG